MAPASAAGDPPGRGYLELADWRRRVAELYATWRVEAEGDPERATLAFRAGRDRLMATHPQSPLAASPRRGSTLSYWSYDPAFRMRVAFEMEPGPGPYDTVDPAAPPVDIPSSGTSPFRLRRVGRVQLAGPLVGLSLPLFWIEGYGNGLFLPFRDATSGQTTYGAGRYLLDTVKGADHGGDPASGILVLDLNMAYHPSCAYDPRWSCPLAPPESHLRVAVAVGERLA